MEGTREGVALRAGPRELPRLAVQRGPPVDSDIMDGERHPRGEHSYAPKVPGQQTPATTALRQAGIAFTLHEYVHDPRVTRYGEEAAAALGVDPAGMFKTLIAQVDAGLVSAMVAVPDTLDLKALAAATGGKRAALADPARAARSTGYVIGGISPLAQRRGLRAVLDEAALERDRVFVSGGRRGLQIELDPRDLRLATLAAVAPIAAR